jgi:hypothetical protein
MGCSPSAVLLLPRRYEMAHGPSAAKRLFGLGLGHGSLDPFLPCESGSAGGVQPPATAMHASGRRPRSSGKWSGTPPRLGQERLREGTAQLPPKADKRVRIMVLPFDE